MNVDDCYSKIVGSFGRYQIFIYISTYPFMISMAGFAILPTFVSADLEQLKPYNQKVNNESSILIEWHLTDRAWISDMIQAIYFVGFIFGLLGLGHISDQYGRKVGLVIGLLPLFPTCFALSFSSCWQMFAVCRFFIGFLGGGGGLVLYVYLQEIVGRSWWAITAAVQGVMFPVGIAAFSCAAYLIPQWRPLIRYLSILQLPTILVMLFVPESPNWLYATEKYDKAEAVLKQLAKRNGVKNPEFKLKPLVLEKAGCSYTLWHVLKHNITRKRMLVMSYLWFVCSFVYYALTLAAADIGKNLYVNLILYGLVELATHVLCPILIDRRWCGRKYGVMSSLFLAGVACLCLMSFEPKVKTSEKLAFGLLGKLSITFSFSAIYVYSPELFPTPVRNIALGSMSMSARVGGILASFASSLIGIHPALGYSVFGICGLSAGFLTLLLPKTVGRKVPASFEEVETIKMQPFYMELSDSVQEKMPDLVKNSSEEKEHLLESDEQMEDEL